MAEQGQDSTSDDGERPSIPRRSARRLRETLNVREEVTKRRGRGARLVEALAHRLAHPGTLVGLLVFCLAWAALNSGLVLGVRAFDPAPYTLLATLVSALSPLLALLILMVQHREARIDELRDEVTVEVAIQTERRVTAMLQLLLREREGRARAGSAAGSDGRPEALSEQERQHLEELTEPVAPDELLDVVLENLNRIEGSSPGVSPDR